MTLRSRKYQPGSSPSDNVGENTIGKYNPKNEDDVVACGMNTAAFSAKFTRVMKSFQLKDKENNPVAELCKHLENNLEKRELAFMVGKKFLVEQVEMAIAEARKNSNQ